VNLTEIKFTKEEMVLLNESLEHSIEKPLNAYRINLMMETEHANKLLDTKMQNPLRILAAKKLKQIFTSGSYNATQKRQKCLMKNVNQRLVKENAIIVKADKRNPSLIICAVEYTEKVHTFIRENNFQILQKTPTHRYKKLLGKTL
jgi:hypothetical protein